MENKNLDEINTLCLYVKLKNTGSNIINDFLEGVDDFPYNNLIDLVGSERKVLIRSKGYKRNSHNHINKKSQYKCIDVEEFPSSSVLFCNNEISFYTNNCLLYGMGNNSNGVLGLELDETYTNYTQIPTKFETPIIQISSSKKSSLVLTLSSSVYGTGVNDNNQLSQGSDVKVLDKFTLITSLLGIPIHQILSLNDYSFALSVTGSLYSTDAVNGFIPVFKDDRIFKMCGCEGAFACINDSGVLLYTFNYPNKIMRKSFSDERVIDIVVMEFMMIVLTDKSKFYATGMRFTEWDLLPMELLIEKLPDISEKRLRNFYPCELFKIQNGFVIQLSNHQKIDNTPLFVPDNHLLPVDVEKYTNEIRSYRRIPFLDSISLEYTLSFGTDLCSIKQRKKIIQDLFASISSINASFNFVNFKESDLEGKFVIDCSMTQLFFSKLIPQEIGFVIMLIQQAFAKHYQNVSNNILRYRCLFLLFLMPNCRGMETLYNIYLSLSEEEKELFLQTLVVLVNGVEHREQMLIIVNNVLSSIEEKGKYNDTAIKILKFIKSAVIKVGVLNDEDFFCKHFNDMMRNSSHPEYENARRVVLYDNAETSSFFCKAPFLFDQLSKKNIANYIFKKMSHEALAVSSEDKICRLKVKRSDLIKTTINQLKAKKDIDFLKGVYVKFEGEEGIDYGGVKRDFFYTIFEKFKLEGYLMKMKNCYWINPHINNDEVYFYFGVLIGLAVYNNCYANTGLPLSFFKKLKCEPLTFDDLVEFDASIYQFLADLNKENVGDADIFMTNPFYEGIPSLVEDSIEVTADNLDQYIELLTDEIFDKSIKTQFNMIAKGINKIIGVVINSPYWSAEDIRIIVSGSENIDFSYLEKSCKVYEPFTNTHPTIKMFWDIVHNRFNDSQRKDLLFFITSESVAPPGGFENSDMTIKIQHILGESLLPTAQTCSNCIYLPLIVTEDVLYEKLLLAISNAYSGFSLR